MANKYLVRNVLQLHENVYKIPNSFFFHLNLQIDRGKSHMLYVVQKQQQQCSGGRSSQFCSTLVEAICSCSSRVAHVVWCVSDQCALYALTDGRPLCLLAAVSRRRAYQWWCIIIPFLLELGFDEQQSPAPKLSYVYCIQQYSM